LSNRVFSASDFKSFLFDADWSANQMSAWSKSWSKKYQIENKPERKISLQLLQHHLSAVFIRIFDHCI